MIVAAFSLGDTVEHDGAFSGRAYRVTRIRLQTGLTLAPYWRLEGIADDGNTIEGPMRQFRLVFP